MQIKKGRLIMETKIHCKAQKCKYHNMNNECEAPSITVGNASACTSCDTCCDTFVAKN